jgi:PAS domain S-box-containing protein
MDTEFIQSAVAKSVVQDELFESAFNHAAIGMAIVATSGRWLKVNSALCDIVGFSESELLATNFQAITHPEDLAIDLGYVTQVLEGVIRSYQMEKRYIHQSGRIVHVLLSVSLVRDSEGRAKFFISQIQDITERVRAQLALESAKQRLETALQEVKELRGILPICSYCKSIRNDQQYWQSLEHYLTEHSNAKLSHGICPGCMPNALKQLEEFAQEQRS